MLKDRIDNFYSEGMKNILNLGRATLNRCLDYRPLISGVLLQMQDEEVLLLKIDAICNKIREKIEANVSKWYVKYFDSDYTEEKILGNLMMEQWITHKRDDGCFDKIIKYPQYGIGEDDNGKIKIDLHKLHRVVKINDKRKDKSMKLEMLSIEKIRKELPAIRKSQLYMGANERKKITKDLEKVLKGMNKLIDLK